MPKIKSINIPQPCYQQWQQMMPVAGGRHCENCCKTVADFTVMTDTQIINYLSRQTNVCGRFDDHQLNRLNERLQETRSANGFFRKIAIAATVLMAIPFVKANAQRKHRTEHAPLKFKRADTLLNVTGHQTGADIKIEPSVLSIEKTMVDCSAKQINSTIGWVSVAGVLIKPAIHRLYTSIYDMLRDL